MFIIHARGTENIQEGECMAIKSRFVGVRLEPAEVRKAILLSLEAGEPGNMSAGLRWALQQASMPSGSAPLPEGALAGGRQPAGEMIHA